jgi:hypothetical protein
MRKVAPRRVTYDAMRDISCRLHRVRVTRNAHQLTALVRANAATSDHQNDGNWYA